MPDQRIEDALNEIGRTLRQQPSLRDAVVKRAIEESVAGRRVAKSVTREHLLWRIVMPASLSAAAAVIVGVFLLVVPSRPVSAQQQFQQVLEANKGYQGWVHIDKGNEALHFNTVDGAVAISQADRGSVDLFLRSKDEHFAYDPKERSVTINTLPVEVLERLKPVLRVFTFEDFLAFECERNGTDKKDVKVQEAKEGELLRFDLEGPGRDGATREVASVWVNPKTKLLKKISGGPAGTETVTLDYGDPVIRDIYDLGVPRDAKVIDLRPAKDVMAVINRLDQRIAKGFGDAVVVESSVGRTNSRYPTVGGLNIYVIKGNKKLWYHYSVGEPLPQEPTWHLVPPLKGWPKPTLADVLELARTTPPHTSLVTDGMHSWQANFDAATGHFSGWNRDQIESATEAEIARTMRAATEEIWRGRQSVVPSSQIRGVRAELRQHRDHPGLLGIWGTGRLTVGTPATMEWTAWIDPARDDMPVESLSQAKDDKGNIIMERRRQYGEYVKLPNGQWYPAHEAVSEKAFDSKPSDPKKESHYYLLIDQTVQVGPEWFVNPAERFGEKRSENTTRP